jgi:hypothetical protein
METKEVRETRNGNRRPAWPFIVAAVLLLILLVLVGRSCREDYDGMPPAVSDTLDTDTMAVPPVYEGMDADTTDPVDTAFQDPEVMTPAVAPMPGAASPGGIP